MNLDLLLVIGWSQILSSAALTTARIGAIGAHASLLPDNRGSAPINWAIIRDEKTTGNSLIWLSDNVDEGRIIDQVEFPISAYDTCETLYQKVAESNRAMIQRVLPRLLAGERPGQPQPPSDEPLLPRRRPTDGLLDWHQSAVNVYNFIRALTRPYPGAFSFLDGRRWTIQSAALLPAVSQEDQVAGTVISSVVSPVAEACGQLVACGSGCVIVLEIEADDGTVLKGTDLSDCDWTGKVWAHE
jgi:methionyl-tRNA formyltransferase